MPNEYKRTTFRGTKQAKHQKKARRKHYLAHLRVCKEHRDGNVTFEGRVIRKRDH